MSLTAVVVAVAVAVAVVVVHLLYVYFSGINAIASKSQVLNKFNATIQSCFNNFANAFLF